MEKKENRLIKRSWRKKVDESTERRGLEDGEKNGRRSKIFQNFKTAIQNWLLSLAGT